MKRCRSANQRGLPQCKLFLATINATIEVDEPEIPPKQRQCDEYIMEMILEDGS
jgi:hypothetical protein